MPEEMQQVIRPKQVYITSYPADPFHDESYDRNGCGAFVAISRDEAQWIYDTGLRLNRLIRYRADQHRWYYVDGITEGFNGHGYCASDDIGGTYYAGLVESLHRQYDLDGTVHVHRTGEHV